MGLPPQNTFDATWFTLFIVRNPQRRTIHRYIPKPVLGLLGNPGWPKFIFRGKAILVRRPD